MGGFRTATAVALAGMVVTSPAWAQSFWAEAAKPYEGVTIRGVSESTPPSNYVKDVLAAQFEEETGIKIEFEVTSWDQMYDKAIKDMEADTGIYDFVYIEQDIIYSYLDRDFLVNITQSLQDNADLASADFSADDFTSFIDANDCRMPRMKPAETAPPRLPMPPTTTTTKLSTRKSMPMW